MVPLDASRSVALVSILEASRSVFVHDALCISDPCDQVKQRFLFCLVVLSVLVFFQFVSGPEVRNAALLRFFLRLRFLLLNMSRHMS